ncbi:hypothetical protein ACLKA7_001892 [Drosophila subpalustris]
MKNVNFKLCIFQNAKGRPLGLRPLTTWLIDFNLVIPSTIHQKLANPPPLSEAEIAPTPAIAGTPTAQQQQQGRLMTPTQVFIAKMRADEEAAVSDCRQVLRKIKAAMMKQRNISMDVKDGVSELSEILTVLETCRSCYIKAETPRNTAKEAVRKDAEMKTPTTSKRVEDTFPTSKRVATSPAETAMPHKKGRDDDVGKWQAVASKKTKKAQKQQTKAQTPKKPGVQTRSENKGPNQQKTNGHSYADVLKSLRANAKFDADVNIKGVRKTRTGALLLELEKGERLNPLLCEQIKAALHETAEVASARPMATIVIRDLDTLTEQEDVLNAVKGLLPDGSSNIKVTVTLTEENAATILAAGKIKIGWIKVKMKRWETVKKCFRCLGIGNMQYDCKGPNRKGEGLCFRCGETGHKITQCQKAPKCWACIDAKLAPVDNLPGSSRCGARKQQNSYCWRRGQTRLQGNGFVWVKSSKYSVMSCNLTPSGSFAEFETKLDSIEDCARGIGEPLVIAGDFNARAVEWGSSSTDSRGRRILDFASILGLVVANSGASTTFRRPGCIATTPDITLVSERLAGALRNWTVLEEYTSSDHQYIEYSIELTSRSEPNNIRRGTRKWKSARLDIPALLTTLDSSTALLRPAYDSETIVQQTMQSIIRACDVAMPRVQRANRRKSTYWWNEEIVELRKPPSKELSENPPPLFTLQELASAAGALKNNKSPGPDGVPTEVLKAIAAERPQVLLDMYNACLVEGKFPVFWKHQKLTLISKGKGNPERADHCAC